MPSINIYIRQDDYPKWIGIEDKPDFIHRALSGSLLDDMKGSGEDLIKAVEKTVPPEQFARAAVQTKTAVQTKMIKTPKEAKMSIPIAPGMKPCKHGSSPEFCKFAKPGKPCK